MKADTAPIPQLKMSQIPLLKPGMKVSAKWMARKGGKDYFNATVTSTNDGCISVIYDDDGTSEDVLCRHIRILDEGLAAIIRGDKDTPAKAENKKMVVLKTETSNSPIPNYPRKTILSNNNFSTEPKKTISPAKIKSDSPNKPNQVVVASKEPLPLRTATPTKTSLLATTSLTNATSRNGNGKMNVKSDLKRKHDDMNEDAQEASSSSPPSKKANYESQSLNEQTFNITTSISPFSSSKSLYEIKKSEKVTQGSFENGDVIQEIIGAGKHSETKELFFIVKWRNKPNSRDRVYDYQFKTDNAEHMQALREFYRSHLVFGNKPSTKKRS